MSTGRKRAEPPEHIDEVARRVIGAAIEVHRVLAPGYLEAVYEEALAIEMTMRGIPYSRQHLTAIEYKGRVVAEGRVDFVVEEELVVDTKATPSLRRKDLAQVISYLTTLGKPLGLLLNFSVETMRKGGIKRVVRTS